MTGGFEGTSSATQYPSFINDEPVSETKEYRALVGFGSNEVLKTSVRVCV